MMQAGPRARAMIEHFEGARLHAYKDTGGVWTIGYGATYYQDGRRVQLSDPAITRDQASTLLLWMVQTVYLPGVRKLCPGVTDAHRLAALIDFTFNLGAGNLASSTLRKRVNASRWEDVPAELRKWTRGGGRVLRGLVLRREAEVELI